MKNRIKCILLVIMTLSITLNINAQEIESCELSDAYIKWTKLSKEDQDKYVKPTVCKYEEIVVSKAKKSILKSSLLPASYNSRSTGKVTGIRNQMDVGSCWAFSSSSMTESYILKNYSKTYQFSTRHMDYASSRYFLNSQINYNGFNRYAGTGGNSYYAANYLINQYGPILESYMPFVNSSPQIALSQISGYPVQADVNGISFGQVISDTGACTSTSINDMKNLIYNNGPITVSIFMSEDSALYNSTTHALYNEVAGSSSNHSVLAVGWDDNYSVDNFVSTNKPSKPGAWIIQNSWGSNWGEDGLFYISYEDTTVCTEYSSIRSVDLNIEDHIYSHDELGYDSAVSYPNSNGNQQGYAMNIFNKASNNEEYIREVTFAMSSPGTYRVYAYKGNLVTDGKTINDMQLIGSGIQSYEGYGTLKLSEPYKLETGVTDFSVAVYYLSNDNNMPIGVSAYFSGITIETGKSYASSNGNTWIDLGIANGRDNRSREASIKVSTDNAQSIGPYLKINSKSVSYPGDIVANFDITTRNIDDLSISIKDASNNTITAKNISYDYFNFDYSKAIITLNNSLNNGNYTVTFTYDTDKTITDTITISKQAITDIAFSINKLTIKANSCVDLPSIVFTPNDNVVKSITWTNKNGNIRIENNQVCAGNYSVNDDELTATSVNNISKSIPVDIIYDYRSLFFYPNYFELNVGEELLLSSTNRDDVLFSRLICFDNSGSSSCPIYWDEMTIASSNSNVIRDVGNYKFKALAAGNAIINLTTKNGKSASISIKVDISITGVDIDKRNVSLNIGDTSQLNTTITPSNTTMSKIIDWESSNGNIVQVDSNGKITAKAIGSATITARTINGYSSTSNVNVYSHITSVSLNKNNLSLTLGNKENLYATINPSDTTDSKILTWTSSNTKVATVDSNGLVTAKGVGSTTITVKTVNNKTSNCVVNVGLPILSVSLNKTNATLIEGDTIQLNTEINPSNTSDSKVIIWTSSDTNLATVDSNGLVTTKGVGTATITAKTSNGKTATCTIIINQRIINIESISLNNTTLSIERYKKYTIVPTINPYNTTNSKEITWTSSNTKVVTVDSNGIIYAKAIGKATITAKTSNGKTTTCLVTVTKVSASSVTVSKISNKTYTGRQIKPSIKVTYAGKTLKYKTDYTISYGKNKSTGKGSIKIKFKGSNYTGTKTVYFIIIPRKVSIRAPRSNSKGTLTVYYYRATGASGYQVAYRLYGTSKWTYVYTSSTSSKKITKLKRNKRYQVKVRAYKTVDGKKNYGSWSYTRLARVK